MELNEQQKKEIAKKVLDMLEKQKFADWYEFDFSEHIEDPSDESKAGMLEDIEEMLKL